jgi:hypothetical protein
VVPVVTEAREEVLVVVPDKDAVKVVDPEIAKVVDPLPDKLKMPIATSGKKKSFKSAGLPRLLKAVKKCHSVPLW